MAPPLSCRPLLALLLLMLPVAGAYPVITAAEVYTAGAGLPGVAVNPANPREFITAGLDFTPRLWLRGAAAPVRSFEGHTAEVWYVAFNPTNDSEFVSASADGTLRLWGTRSGLCLGVFSGHTASVTSVAFGPSGDELLSASLDYRVVLWHRPSGTILRNFTGHTSWVRSVAFHPRDPEEFASGSDDSTVRIWNKTTGAVKRVLSGHGAVVYCVAYDHVDPTRVASVSADTTARLWTTNGTTLQSFSYGNAPLSVAFNPRTGTELLVGGDEHKAYLYSTADASVLLRGDGHSATIGGVAFNPANSSEFFTAGHDGTVRIWAGAAYVPTGTATPTATTTATARRPICSVLIDENGTPLRARPCRSV